MRFLDKRGISLAPETLVKLMLLVAFLVIVLGLLFLVQGGLSNDSAKKYSCWISSSARSSGSFLSDLFPDTCTARVMEDALDMRGLSVLLRDTWWQFGAGKSDFSIKEGDIYEAAKFKVSEEMKIDKLLEYLLTHKKGRASSVEASDYNYLQQDAIGSTVCFDSSFAEDDFKLKEGQEYELYFADSTAFGDISLTLQRVKSDRLVVMKELKPRSFWTSRNAFFCLSPLTKVISEHEILQESSWLLGGGWE